MNTQYKFIKFKDFIVYFNNEESAKQTLTEVFGHGQYQFKTNKRDPSIIDAGSHIGIATLFFKMHYPVAKIICFELDPNVFDILKLNIQANQLKNVTLVNAALSSIEGAVDFYGQIYVKNPDARGNSIIDVWGAQRAVYNKIQVASVKLSSYVDSEVDFLKLDIEGAEEQVLRELGGKLKLFKAMVIEFHEAQQLQAVNNMDRIKFLLKEQGFNYETIPNDMSILPKAVQAWAKKINPRLYIVSATREGGVALSRN